MDIKAVSQLSLRPLKHVTNCQQA